MVRLAGIEPTTPWFVAKYSIQLSYSRNSHNYAMEEKNYITPAGHERIRSELLQLLNLDRPEVVKVVHWAASNGDRSENGDYIYGKSVCVRSIDGFASSINAWNLPSLLTMPPEKRVKQMPSKSFLGQPSLMRI